MSWNLKGRQALASLDPATKYRVVHSHVMTRCANKPFLWVLEELTTVSCVGGLSGPTQKVEYFLCLVARLLQICPMPDLVLAMLRQSIHKCVRVAAMLVIRLIGSVEMVNEAVSVGLDDYRKIRIYGDEDGAPVALLVSERDSSGGGASLALGGATFSAGKHPRTGGVSVEDAQKLEDARLEALMNLKPPHYFIWPLDRVTVEMFGLESAALDGQRFLGVPLPPLVDRPAVPPFL